MMNATESIDRLLGYFSRTALVDEDVSIRLYNSVTTNAPVPTIDSFESVCSANDMGQSCRICRWNRSDQPIVECPCLCKGSVGYVHLKCLRRWVLHRGDSRCEICGTRFTLTPDERNYKKLFWSFFQWKYLGAITKNFSHLMSLCPVSYLVLYQVLQFVDNLQLEENPNVFQVVVLAPAILLTSSIIFFHIFEFSIAKFLTIKSIFKHWWKFGDQDLDNDLDLEVPSEFFEFS